MKLAWRFVTTVSGFVLAAWISMAPAAAHHSFAAQYDANKPLTLKGVVTKMEWMNPHSRFYVDVKDETGKTVNWNVELASPNVLLRQGWTRDSLKPGDLVTVEASHAKDGSEMANAQRVTLSDGRRDQLRITETFTKIGPDTITWTVTYDDPVFYTKPFSVSLPMQRQKYDILEMICMENNLDIPYLITSRPKP